MGRRSLMVSVVLVVVVALGIGATELFAGKPPGGGTCPKAKPGCICPDIYAPVVCDNNCRYSNICVARCAGATNCIGVGPAPVE